MVFLFHILYFRVFFFFFKQKTAYEMRISDWSSDVCSSDLLLRRRTDIAQLPLTVSVRGDSIVVRVERAWLAKHPLSDFTLRAEESEWRKVGFSFEQIGRASCRERVCKYV